MADIKIKIEIYTGKLRKLDVDIVKRDFNVFVILLLSLLQREV